MTVPSMSNEQMQALFDAVSNWGRWGPDDERGALNHLTAAETRQTAGLIRSGRVVSLSRDFPTVPGPENPFPAHHHMVIAGDDPCIPGMGLEVSTDYIGIAFHGMASSHLDALCHVFQGGRMYNGFPATDVKSTGARRNTVMTLKDGLVHDDSDVAGLEPGVARWLHERKVAVLGGDGVHDPIPPARQNIDWPMPIHMIGLVAMGLHLLDNLNLERVAEACADEQRHAFLLTLAPLRISGGTGSPLNPIAVF